MTSTVATKPLIQSRPLTTVDPVAIIRLAESRGVVLETDGENLRVNGSAPAIAALRPHLVAAKGAVIAHLVASAESNPADRGQSRGGQGEASEGRSSNSSPTPLTILAALQFDHRHRFQPTADAIDLVMWLTQSVESIRADVAAGRDTGFVVDSSHAGHPIATTVSALARGPTQGESPAMWLTRIQNWREIIEGGEGTPPSSWRSSRGYVVAEWPAERKRPPRVVADPKRVDKLTHS